MKRSITLLISNILATLYTGYLLLAFGGAIVEAGGEDALRTIRTSFKFIFDLVGTNDSAITFVYVVLVLLCVHIGLFVLGCLIGWIAFLAKKSGGAKFAATLYLIGSICFPFFLIFGLPITIVGFIGGGKQKKINSKPADNIVEAM